MAGRSATALVGLDGFAVLSQTEEQGEHWLVVETTDDVVGRPSCGVRPRATLGGGPGEKDELFLGYFLSLATMVGDEDGDAVPELVRRMNLVSCDHDPVPEMVGVVVELPKAGIALGDVICDSGYAHRVPTSFALPLRGPGQAS